MAFIFPREGCYSVALYSRLHSLSTLHFKTRRELGEKIYKYLHSHQVFLLITAAFPIFCLFCSASLSPFPSCPFYASQQWSWQMEPPLWPILLATHSMQLQPRLQWCKPTARMPAPAHLPRAHPHAPASSGRNQPQMGE